MGGAFLQLGFSGGPHSSWTDPLVAELAQVLAAGKGGELAMARIKSADETQQFRRLFFLSIIRFLANLSDVGGAADMSEDRVLSLIQSLRIGDAAAREEAILGLRALGGENQLGGKQGEVTLALRHRLSDGEKPVRYNAAIALGFIDPSVRE